jgi:hypothetical protein
MGLDHEDSTLVNGISAFIKESQGNWVEVRMKQQVPSMRNEPSLDLESASALILDFSAIRTSCNTFMLFIN